MRAAVLRTVGGVPSCTAVPTPAAGSGQSLVAVTAAPVVPLDLLCASGTTYLGRPAVPYVPGVQGVGVVAESALHPAGTRVWFSTTAGMARGDGSYAELCLVPDTDLVPITADVGDAALAALGLSAVAAWMSLTCRGGLRTGESVVVLGAGGAVGQAAVGAAKLLDAGRVVAVCRSPEAADRARRAGADQVVTLSADVDELAAGIRAAAGGPVDLVIDPVFGTAATAAALALAERGRLVNLGGASADVATFSSEVLRSKTADVLGYTNNALTREQRHAAITAIAEHAAAGHLAVAHERRALAAVAEAWQQQATGSGVRQVLIP